MLSQSHVCGDWYTGGNSHATSYIHHQGKTQNFSFWGSSKTHSNTYPPQRKYHLEDANSILFAADSFVRFVVDSVGPPRRHHALWRPPPRGLPRKGEVGDFCWVVFWPDGMVSKILSPKTANPSLSMIVADSRILSSWIPTIKPFPMAM